MIRVDAVWLAVEPLDMRAGTEAAMTRVVSVFGSAWPRDTDQTLALTQRQLGALVLGLPWQRIGEAGIISGLQLPKRGRPAQLPDVLMRSACVAGTINFRDHHRPPRHAAPPPGNCARRCTQRWLRFSVTSAKQHTTGR